MKDFIKPSIRLKPDVVILHVGTNDLTKKEIETVKNLEQIHKYIKDESSNTKLIISTLTTRNDRDDIENVVTKSNDVICSFFRRHDINVVDNNNIESQHLGLKKLHLNRKGTSLLALNLDNIFSNTSECQNLDNIFNNISTISRWNQNNDITIHPSLKILRSNKYYLILC